MSTYGLDTGDLPDDYTPLEAIVLLKALDPDGHPAYFIRRTPTMSATEEIGLLHIARNLATGEFTDTMEPDQPDPDGDDD